MLIFSIVAKVDPMCAGEQGMNKESNSPPSARRAARRPSFLAAWRNRENVA